MSQIEISSRPSTGNRLRTQPALWSRQSRLNDVVAWLLLAIVALAPIPLGSNRGFFWGLTAVAVGVTGAFHTIRLSQLGEPYRFDIRQVRLSAVLVVLLAGYLIIQALPLGALASWVPPIAALLTVTTAGGDVLQTQSISLAPEATWLMLLRLGTYVVFYALMLQIATNHRRKSLVLNSIVVIVTVYGMFGLVSLVQLGDTILGLPKWAYAGMATATFVNANSFATFLAIGAVVALSLAAGKLVRSEDDEDHGRRPFDPFILLHLLAYAIMIAALFATQSRMGLAAALVGSFVVISISLFRSAGGVARAIVILSLFGLAIALGFVVYGQGVLERLGSVESSADVRLELYGQVVQMIMARPFLGYGGGAFELAYPLFHTPPVSADLVWDRAHNTYLALWVELGVIAGSIPIVLLLVAGRRIVAGLRRVRADWTAKVAATAVLVVGGLHSLVDFSLEIQATTLLFLAVIATGAAGIAKSGHGPR